MRGHDRDPWIARTRREHLRREAHLGPPLPDRDHGAHERANHAVAERICDNSGLDRAIRRALPRVLEQRADGRGTLTLLAERSEVAEPDEPSPDDPTIGQSGLVGVPLVAQVLGGRVIDEQITI